MALPASVTALARTALEVLRTRVELALIELAQEQERLTQLALRAALAVVTIGLGLQLAVALAVAAFWDTPYRLLAASAGVALFAVLGAASVFACLRTLRSRPRAFDATRQTLLADLQALT